MGAAEVAADDVRLVLAAVEERSAPGSPITEIGCWPLSSSSFCVGVDECLRARSLPAKCPTGPALHRGQPSLGNLK